MSQGQIQPHRPVSTPLGMRRPVSAYVGLRRPSTATYGGRFVTHQCADLVVFISCYKFIDVMHIFTTFSQFDFWHYW